MEEIVETVGRIVFMVLISTSAGFVFEKLVFSIRNKVSVGKITFYASLFFLLLAELIRTAVK